MHEYGSFAGISVGARPSRHRPGAHDVGSPHGTGVDLGTSAGSSGEISLRLSRPDHCPGGGSLPTQCDRRPVRSSTGHRADLYPVQRAAAIRRAVSSAMMVSCAGLPQGSRGRCRPLRRLPPVLECRRSAATSSAPMAVRACSRSDYAAATTAGTEQFRNSNGHGPRVAGRSEDEHALSGLDGTRRRNAHPGRHPGFIAAATFATSTLSGSSFDGQHDHIRDSEPDRRGNRR